MYVLIARAMRTNGGPIEGQLVLMTSDLKKVVQTARDSDKLGYTFARRPDKNEGLFVYLLTKEHPYESGSLEFAGLAPPKGHPLVFERVTSSATEGWTERWFDRKLQNEFEGKPEEEPART
jgi:hypothetical protein